MKLLPAVPLFGCYLLVVTAGAAELAVTIRADFPGGNVSVLQNDGATVQVTPDLRGGQPWFYWHFAATASQPGRVTFVFPATPRIGVRGPAVSLDDGRTWRWLGTDNVVFAAPAGNGEASKRESFAYDFTAEHLTVRFAVAIPYLQDNLTAFLKAHAANKHLQTLRQWWLICSRRFAGCRPQISKRNEPPPNKCSTMKSWLRGSRSRCGRSWLS